MDFSKQELGLIHDLIKVAWEAGAVKNPQMGGALEQLRVKVVGKIETKEQPPKAVEEKLKKVQ